jgi:hypothetical protein
MALPPPSRTKTKAQKFKINSLHVSEMDNNVSHQLKFLQFCFPYFKHWAIRISDLFRFSKFEFHIFNGIPVLSPDR